MKRLFALAACIGLLAMACVTLSCGRDVWLIPHYSVLPGGDTILLSWNAIPGADGYYVYLDGARNAVSSLSFKVGTPTRLIEVSSHTGNVEDDRWRLNTGIVKTSAISVDNVNGWDPNQAFYFSSSDSAIAIPLTQVSDIDFVMDTSGTSTVMRSPDTCYPVYNNKHNSSAMAATTDFDNYDIAEDASAYNTARTISGGALYSLWIDPANNGWSTDDHFAKMKVVGIWGNSLLLTLGYQRIGGLRWLKSP